MKAKYLLKGLLSYVPGTERLLEPRCTGGSVSATYCYGVWLKHLTMLRESGLESLPRVLAELGPGDSIGTGLAAILSGVDTYYALDVIRVSNPASNLTVFDELVALFKNRAPRPDKGWPDFDEHLDARLFPSHILTEDILRKSLADHRIAAIREAIVSGRKSGAVSIDYMVPWSDANMIRSESVDVIISHSVLEHVDDLESTYLALASWLKPGGLMSHQIDLTSHGVSEKWNGYRAYSELLWKLARGRRPFFINRQPCSTHMHYLRSNGFEILRDLHSHEEDGISRQRVSKAWAHLSDEDLNCSGLFVQARKPATRSSSVR